MGYQITNVGSTAVKKSVVEVLPLWQCNKLRLSDTYQDFYKADIDVTDLDLFAYQLDNNTASDIKIKLVLDTTTVFEDTVNNGTWGIQLSKDISSYTGVKTVKVALEWQGVGNATADNVIFWIRGS